MIFSLNKHGLNIFFSKKIKLNTITKTTKAFIPKSWIEHMEQKITLDHQIYFLMPLFFFFWRNCHLFFNKLNIPKKKCIIKEEERVTQARNKNSRAWRRWRCVTAATLVLYYTAKHQPIKTPPKTVKLTPIKITAKFIKASPTPSQTLSLPFPFLICSFSPVYLSPKPLAGY